MSSIKIEISRDKLNAYISLTSPIPGREIIEEELSKTGIVYGLDHQGLDEIISLNKPVERRQIAHGLEAKPGKDSELVWFIEIGGPQKPLIKEDGKADFKQLQMMIPVEENQELISKLPAENGVAGKTVTGEVISGLGKDIEIQGGRNTKLSDDGLTLTAVKKGYAFIREGELYVDDVCEIKGNVDFRTGNIKFNGTIIIHGDVRSGFRIDATDSIIVNGSVEAAYLYSQNGDIIIKGGILGKERAKIIAGRNCQCGFIQNATVRVKEDLVVKRYAINSNISAGHEVLMDENEGLIRGGKIIADHGMTVMEIGHKQKIKTEVGLSGFEAVEMATRKMSITEEQASIETQISGLEKQIQFFLLLKDRLGELAPDKETSLKNAEYKIIELRKKILHLDQSIKPDTLVPDPSKIKSITVKNTLHSGVTLTIGELQHFVEQPMEGVRIFRSGSDFTIEKI